MEYRHNRGVEFVINIHIALCVEDIVNKLQYIKEFGITIFAIKAIRHITLKSNSKFSWKVNAINENAIEKFLTKTVEKAKVTNKNIELRQIRNNVKDEPIWVMWYQGMENAPEIVQCCVESIKEHSTGHEVIVLSEGNLHEYIELPEFVMEKFRKGYISRTHLSDMIRLNLLYLYGGAWLDATLLVTDDIPVEYFQKDIFSLRFGKETKDPSHGRWTTFCFFAKKGNTLIEQTLKYHYYYWKQENYPVDYVMFDYFINYIIKHDNNAARQIAEITTTNVAVFDLIDRLNTPYEKNMPLVNDKGTIFSKLSWKRQYMTVIEGKQTVYGYLLERYLKVENSNEELLKI